MNATDSFLRSLVIHGKGSVSRLRCGSETSHEQSVARRNVRTPGGSGPPPRKPGLNPPMIPQNPQSNHKMAVSAQRHAPDPLREALGGHGRNQCQQHGSNPLHKQESRPLEDDKSRGGSKQAGPVNKHRYPTEARERIHTRTKATVPSTTPTNAQPGMQTRPHGPGCTQPLEHRTPGDELARITCVHGPARKQAPGYSPRSDTSPPEVDESDWRGEGTPLDGLPSASRPLQESTARSFNILRSE